MRLDKFLKVSRIIKRRTLSKEMSEASRVKVNGKVAKPSTKLKIGDIIEIEFGRSILVVKVNELRDHVLKDDSHMLYDIIEEKKKEETLALIYQNLEDRMKSVMGTKVSIHNKDKNKGRIEIEYYSEAELERIVEMIESIGCSTEGE